MGWIACGMAPLHPSESTLDAEKASANQDVEHHIAVFGLASATPLLKRRALGKVTSVVFWSDGNKVSGLVHLTSDGALSSLQPLSFGMRGSGMSGKSSLIVLPALASSALQSSVSSVDQFSMAAASLTSLTSDWLSSYLAPESVHTGSVDTVYQDFMLSILPARIVGSDRATEMSKDIVEEDDERYVSEVGFPRKRPRFEVADLAGDAKFSSLRATVLSLFSRGKGPATESLSDGPLKRLSGAAISTEIVGNIESDVAVVSSKRKSRAGHK
jgi:hypothetical protein